MTLTKKQIKNFCLFDDVFFRAFIDGHPECTAEILKVVLGMPKIRIIRHEVQKQISNGEMRGVRLDVYAENEENGDLYNIEIQKTDEPALSQRARYYSSLIDANCSIKQNEPFSVLPRSYVIFICRDDILKMNRAICRFERRTEDGIELGDGSSIIYVNGSYKGKDDLGLLMKDFNQRNEKKISNVLFAERFAETKKEVIEKKGSGSMVVTYMDNLIKEKEEAAREAAREETKAEFVRNMLSKSNMSCEEIANLTGVPLEDVKKIAESA